MSIASRQVKKELNRIIEERMKEGYIPTVEYLISKMSDYYKKVAVGTPSFQMRRQTYRSPWDVEDYNNNISEIYDDLNNLYEEMVSQFTIVLKDFDFTDTERRKLLHEIQTLDGELQSLLIVSTTASNYFYSVFDDFRDRSKADLRYTTCEINTEAGSCTLRESKNGISKVDMSHYFNIVNFPITAQEQYAAGIVSNTVFPNTKFGYAFSDSQSAWIQNIITSVPGELEVSFIIDISPENPDGIYISRIEAIGQSPNKMSVQPLWSVDNINFIHLPMGYSSNTKEAADGKTTIWNFSKTRLRYVKFVIKKDHEDEQISNKDTAAYRYVIGFRNISIYSMAYNSSSVLYSKAFTITDPTGESLTIDKAALYVDQDTQDRTSIKYYLSLGTQGEDNPSNFNWVNISAENDPIPTEQQIADFRQVSFFNEVPDIKWDESSYDTALETYNGIPFYKVYEFPYEPLRDSVEIYRGKNEWQVIPRYLVSRRSVYDEEKKFGEVSTITLNFPNFVPSEGQGLIRGSVKVKSEPGNNPGYVYINPSDYTVNYTTKVITKSTGSSILSEPDATSNTVYVDYQYDSESELPTQYVSYLYILNTDGLDLNIAPYNQSEIENGNMITMETEGNVVDVSSMTFYHVPPGWHKIVTTGEPGTIDDRFFYANGNKSLSSMVYKQYAYSQPLQEVSWFDLKYNTLITDHSKYCITDYDNNGTKSIIVNYRPQTTPWQDGLDLLGQDGAEIYVISYRFISVPTDTIYLKAEFSREDGTDVLTTPTLRSYTIKLGY